MPGTARLARCASSPSAIEEVIAKSSPKVSPAHRRTVSACSTGSSMPSNQSLAAEASSFVGRSAVEITAAPPSRSGGPRRPADKIGMTSRRLSPRTGGFPRRRSTGSGTAAAAAYVPPSPLSPCSHQPLLVGPRHVGREPLARLPPLEVAAQHPLAVVGGLGLGHLVTAELAAERGLDAEVAAEVHLEALDHLAGVVAHHRALEADVRGLEAGAAVGAPVDVDRDRLVELRQPLLELGVEVLRMLLGLDDRQLAELQPGAGHRAAAERAGPHLQVVGGQRVDQ